MKTVLFVPGFQEDLGSRNYEGVMQLIRAKGYEVVFVPINWKRTTIVDWTGQLELVYRNYDSQNTILAGFSYGSMTALVMAAKRLPSELWLFSLSPYFAEDIPLLSKKLLGGVGKWRVEKFTTLSFRRLSPLITCPVKLFAGSEEMKRYPIIGDRFEVAKKSFAHCQAVVASGAGHAVDHPAYIAAIGNAI